MVFVWLVQSRMKKLAQDAFCSWVRAYTAHRGDLKRIFMVKKLHLGHVARSFGLKDQPSLVGRSFQTQVKKRKRDQRHVKSSKKRKLATKGGKNIWKYRHFLVLWSCRGNWWFSCTSGKWLPRMLRSGCYSLESWYRILKGWVYDKNLRVLLPTLREQSECITCFLL